MTSRGRACGHSRVHVEMHATHFETLRKTSSVSENYLRAESFTNTYFTARICCFSQLLLTSNKLTMTSVGPSFFVLGLFVASVTANETSTTAWNATDVFDNTTQDENNTLTVPDNIDMNNKNVSSTISTMSTTTINSTIRSSTTDSGDEKKPTTKATPFSVTPKPVAPTSSTSTTKGKEMETTKVKPRKASASDSTGIIILVVIIIVAVGFGVACYVARKRGRRYSVDFASRPDETNIPLSAVEPELPADTVSQNGLQTFADVPTKQPEAPEQKPEAQEEPKAEADKAKTEAGPDAESAAPATSDKPKEDVAEESPPAPVEPNAEEKTDDESVVSNKTSVESLKETNENNSNNVDVSQQRDLLSSKLFWDVPLDSPV